MGLVTAGAMIANIASYLMHVPASRWLGLDGYSEFASLIGLQLLLAVPGLALQTVIARDVVRGAPLDRLRALELRCAAIVAVVAVAAVPIVVWALQVGLDAAVAALITAPLLVLLSGEQGRLQGENRFGELAFVLALTGVARAAPAVLVLGLGGGPAAALAASAVGFAVATFVASRLAGRSGEPRARTDVAAPGVVAVLRASQVQLVLIALTSVDLILSRVVLDSDDASLYALGAVATKVAFWLPQAVGMVLYPRMANPQQLTGAMRLTLSVLVGLGVLTVGAVALASPLVPLIVGDDYAPIQGMLWAFAADGAFLAVLQGALLVTIATERTVVAAIAWVVLAVEIALILVVAGSIGELIAVAASGAAIAAVAAWSVELFEARRRELRLPSRA
ncbi:polysaccharide biosynthesis protein [Aldersonia sp. NBC_00410]|uniref:polysaccharide biosynthesis protein n=1 Tax=Aldersonia sp. NBC_00410 TaxID=2975954 RepID=UPI002251D2AA|nr:polysaccharide biosynthesis protein [Aldersonia sp. NBC_00410]MCX5043046.1 polysaccharide biosynthesis protein [Aldersonia sp. NBC_00410]